MKSILLGIVTSVLLLVTINPTHSQTPTDALFMPAGDICAAVMADHSFFNHYWEGTYLRTNETIATVRRQTLQSMAAVGITDKINLIIGLPYVITSSSEPNGGKFAGAKGFQDLSATVKVMLMSQKVTAGTFEIIGTVGGSTPVSNYLSDYMPYSLGHGATEVSGRIISRFLWDDGMYLRGSGAFLWRGMTQIERDYYWANGGIYSDMMDVPNAIHSQLAIGKWMLSGKLRIEATYTGLFSQSGDDIRSYSAPQPTNQVEMGAAGLFGQYYISPGKGFGFVAWTQQVLHGRNAGRSTSFGGGITYQFTYKN